MAAPTTIVEIGFDLDADARTETGFIIDDPVQGVIDSEYLILDLAWTDITEHVAGVGVRRGRSNELDRHQAGQATLNLHNHPVATVRPFDPLDTAATWSTQLTPRRPVRITSAGEPVFTGHATGWQFTFQPDQADTVTVTCADGFDLLAERTVSAHAVSAQTTGARIESLLDRAEIDWSGAMRSIDTGVATLASATLAEGGALQHLQAVEASEPGRVFIARDGKLTFVDRAAAPTARTSVVFSDTGSDVPFTAIDVDHSSDLLFNRVTLTRTGGGTVMAENTASIQRFGSRDLSRTVQLSTDEAAQELADWWAARYSTPRLRVRSVTVNLADLSSADQATVLAVELGDLVRVVWASTDEWCSVDAVDHQISPGSHTIRFGLSLESGGQILIIDDPQVGLIDTNLIGF